MQRFTDETLHQFHASLANETKLLRRWFKEGYFCQDKIAAGFEFEFWLTDQQGQLVDHNLNFLSHYKNPAVVPEVGRSSLEINTAAFPLADCALSQLQENLSSTWQHCRSHANQHHYDVFAMGMAPGLDPKVIEHNMTPLPRFIYLDDTLAFLRQRNPYHIHIEGQDTLDLQEHTIGINGFTSSFQVHMQIPFHAAKRYYNAAQIVTAPILAIAGNAPYFCGKALWHETRIPLFEQVMHVNKTFDQESLSYSLFGENYIQHSLMELFEQNYNNFPPLIPLFIDDNLETMKHTLLQNSTIYRWNRPIIDFGSDGQPHLRIEFRALPAGPSVVDMVANAALFYGLTEYFATQSLPPENQLPFHAAKKNFYQAARWGIKSELTWFNQQIVPAITLVQHLLPAARQGLQALALNATDIDFYLGIIQDRLKHRTSGSHWAQQFMSHHDHDFDALKETIIHQQKQTLPIHCWPLQ